MGKIGGVMGAGLHLGSSPNRMWSHSKLLIKLENPAHKDTLKNVQALVHTSNVSGVPNNTGTNKLSL